MIVAIKSEMDSRVLLYPLMRSLMHLGTMCVISSNKQLRRLVDDEEGGGFRNIRVIVEQEQGSDEILTSYGIAKNDYDFIILDDVGAVEYDKVIIPLGAKHSELFDEDVIALLSNEREHVHVVQFGKKEVNQTVNVELGKQRETVPLNEDEDLKRKFAKQDKARTVRKLVTVPFPTLQAIEDVEAEYKFYEVPQALIEAFYAIFKSSINMNISQFGKEVRKNDKSSGNFKSRNTTRA